MNYNYEIEWLQKQIDNEHRHSLWYGGRVAKVQHKGYTFVLGAFGDVYATLFDKTLKKEVAFVKDEQDNGRFYEEMHEYLKSDDDLEACIENGRLVVEDCNWFEVLVYDQDGEPIDMGDGWVCDSDYYDDSLKEMLDGMDEFIEELDRNAY